MNETLVGVIVGGLIAWIAPLLTLRYGERKWKTEALIAQLRADRDRMESIYDRALQKFSEGAEVNSYSTPMIADFLVLMPKEVSDLFVEHMKDKEKSEEKIKGRVLEIATAMRRDLKIRDKAIADLLR